MEPSPERWRAALRSFIIRLAAIALLALTIPVTPSLAQGSGHVRLKIVKASLLVGGGVGSGVLTYRGRDYPFRISGLSLGVAAGASVSSCCRSDYSGNRAVERYPKRTFQLGTSWLGRRTGSAAWYRC